MQRNPYWPLNSPSNRVRIRSRAFIVHPARNQHLCCGRASSTFPCSPALQPAQRDSVITGCLEPQEDLNIISRRSQKTQSLHGF
jgi:hypothetical protein